MKTYRGKVPKHAAQSKPVLYYYKRRRRTGRPAMVLRVSGIFLIMFSLFIFAQVAYTDIFADLGQIKLKSQWAKTSSSPQDSPTMAKTSARQKETRPPGNAKEHALRPIGRPFARIAIPKIGLDAIVLQGVDTNVLMHGPGHMEETAYPGEIGNMVISGHRVTYSHPFYNLDRLEQGDPIEIYTGKKKFVYLVAEKKVVSPTDLSVTQPTPDRTLTLTTCNPRFSAKTRMVVIAKMQ